MNATQIEARMRSDAKREALKHLRQAPEIAKLAGVSTEAMNHDLERWKAEHLIFSVEHEDSEYFPLYALNPRANYRPYPAVKEIISILGGGLSSLGIAAWFPGTISFLDDERPLDLLANDPEKVIAAARDWVEEITHG
jgi:hypothetical protein